MSEKAIYKKMNNNAAYQLLLHIPIEESNDYKY